MATTLKDIAQATGLSISTVSRVVSGKGYVSEEARQKTEQAIAELGYQHHKRNRRFPDDSSDQVLVLIGGVSNSVSSSRVELLCDKLVQRRKQPLVGLTHFLAEREYAYLNMAAERHFFGVITFTIGSSNKTARLLRHYPCPLVMLERYLPMKRIDCLHADYYKIGFDCATYLIEHGHTRIAFVGGSSTSTITQDKSLGFADCMHAHGFDVPESHLLHLERSSYMSGVDIVDRILELKPRPTALVTSNDASAGIVHELMRRGIRVPQNMSVISGEDTPLTQNAQVPITSMSIDDAQMCSDAVKTLFKRRRQPDAPFTHTYYDPEIRERASVMTLQR